MKFDEKVQQILNEGFILPAGFDENHPKEWKKLMKYFAKEGYREGKDWMVARSGDIEFYNTVAYNKQTQAILKPTGILKYV